MTIDEVDPTNYEVIITQDPKELSLILVKLTYKIDLHGKVFRFNSAEAGQGARLLT